MTETYVDTIEKKSPFAQFTPYELYLKLLYEYFRGELNRPKELRYGNYPSTRAALPAGSTRFVELGR